jgi:DNA-binding beta-propeller fold protein YncE
MSARRLTLTALASLCAFAGGLSVWSAPALAARGHVFSLSFGSEGAGEGQFSAPAGVAVNESSGDVYVVDKGNDRVEYFSSTGAYIGEFDGSGSNLLVEEQAAPSGRFSEPEGIVVDNDPASPSFGDVYIADVGHNVIDKYSSTGAYVGQLAQGSGGASLGRLYGIAVDSAGTLWVYQESNEVDSFSGAVANEFLSSRHANAFATERGFAVDSNDDLYIKTFFSGVTKLNSSGEVLVQEFDSLFGNEHPSGIAVDLSSNDVYIDNADGQRSVGRFSSSGSLIEKFGSEQLTHGTGLAIDSDSETVYVADSAADALDIFVPEPPGAPTVAGESVSKVTANSATFKAQVNAKGASTEYHFEYGRCTSLSTCAASGYEKSVPLPDASIGSEFGMQNVNGHPQDLLAGAVYHFRAVAHNEFGTTDGEEKTLVTQAVGQPFQLPDGRAWEMVSPPQKEGALLSWIAEGIVQASADGNAFTDTSLFEPIEENAASAYGFSVADFFGRGPGGWASKTIAPPHSGSSYPPVGNGQEYRMFSEDLSKGILQPFGPVTPLTPEVTESTPYLRTDYLSGNPGELCASGCFQPLVSTANVPPGTKYGEEPNGKCESVFCGPDVIGGSPDLSHVVLSSTAALTSTPLEEHQGLYEWSAGKLALVSLLPQGETNEAGGAVANVSTGAFNQVSRHMVSNDGSRVIWLGNPARFGAIHLYLGDVSKGKTLRLDVPNTGVLSGGGEPGAPLYMTATSDASRIFFLDTERLTEDSTAKSTYPQQSDLYEYNLNAPAGNRLTDLTVDKNAGESADVNMVTGASEDGSYIYFTANGALAQGAGPGECGGNSQKPGETQLCNLYVRHNGKTTFIAGLSAEDFPDWSTNLSGLPARVSPDGHLLAFMSNRKLTGYDNTDAVSGRPDEEVYLYDASANRLVCASCDPTGARPVGVEYGSEVKLVNADRVFNSKTWIASNVPPWTRFNLSEARYQSRYLSNRGRLFFDSHDALVPQDVNGTQDVYEYEPAGVGDCSPANIAFGEASGGCVTPVSSGTSNEESAFLDASETGGDVFFLTNAKLAPQDFDSTFDIYDARECSAQSPCIAPAPVIPPPCVTGDGCKPAPSPQPETFGSPASATFAGAGNLTPSTTPVVKPRSLTRTQRLARALKACHKRKGKRRAVCERQARARYAAKQSRKDNATKRGRG